MGFTNKNIQVSFFKHLNWCLGKKLITNIVPNKFSRAIDRYFYIPTWKNALNELIYRSTLPKEYT